MGTRIESLDVINGLHRAKIVRMILHNILIILRLIYYVTSIPIELEDSSPVIFSNLTAVGGLLSLDRECFPVPTRIHPAEAAHLCSEFLHTLAGSLPQHELRWSTERENASPELGPLPIKKSISLGGVFCQVVFRQVTARVDVIFPPQEFLLTGLAIIADCFHHNKDGYGTLGPQNKLSVGRRIFGKESPDIIARSKILSGKGGVGKSSITTQLALSLCLAGHSVGVLDVDLTGPSIPRLLNLESAKITQAFGGWLPVEVHASQTLPPPPVRGPSPNPTENGLSAQNGDTSMSSAPPLTPAPQPTTTAKANDTAATHKIGALHAISLGFLLPSRSSAVVWRGPKKTAMIRQFMSDVLWPPLDYLLIDTPPGTSDEHISLAETLLSAPPPTTVTSSSASPIAKLAGAVVVTTPQAVAVSDVRKELNFCKKVGIDVLGVVENMSGYVCECCGVETNLFGKGGGEVMAVEFGVRFLGRVPVDGQWAVLVEEGRRP
ncbi:MAG: hypothetical protein Q9214_005953, partial [Letrouitia sp. 1 TL-2023]